MTKSKYTLSYKPETLLEIEKHCFSETRTEVGGFLVGVIDGTKIEVTHVLTAKHTVAQMTQLTFTHKTWDTAFAELGKIDKEAKLIGWFHSHPNFGVFLSDHDKFIQSQFFGNDGQVTIVVDPIRGRSGWFVSDDKQIEILKEEGDTKTPKIGESKSDAAKNIEAQLATVSSGSEITWGRVVGISALFSLLGMMGGYLLGGAGGGSNEQIGSLERKITQIEFDLSEALARLDSIKPKATNTPAPKPAASKSSGTVKKPSSSTDNKSANKSGKPSTASGTSSGSTKGGSTSGGTSSGKSGGTTSGGTTSGGTTTGGASGTTSGGSSDTSGGSNG